MKKLLTNLSQIQYSDKKLYIPLISDCFNREFLSHHDRQHEKELYIDTFTATLQRYNLKGAILHSDIKSPHTNDTLH